MYFVYILWSDKDKRTYVGFTKNLETRLYNHNTGRVTATKNRRPLQLIFSEEFTTAQEAKKRELWWKSGTGREKLKEIFNMLLSSKI